MKAPSLKWYTVTVPVPIAVSAVNEEHAATEARLTLICLDGWVRDGRNSRPDFDALDYAVSLVPEQPEQPD